MKPRTIGSIDFGDGSIDWDEVIKLRESLNRSEQLTRAQVEDTVLRHLKRTLNEKNIEKIERELCEELIEMGALTSFSYATPCITMNMNGYYANCRGYGVLHRIGQVDVAINEKGEVIR